MTNITSPLLAKLAFDEPKDLVNKKAAKQLLSSETTPHVLPLVVLIQQHYPESIENLQDPWHPQTFREEMYRDFGIAPSEDVISRIFCGIELLSSNSFWMQSHVFSRLCNVMGEDMYDDPEVIEPADVSECNWGLVQASLIYPPEEEENGGRTISPDVEGFLIQSLKHEGFVKTPRPMSGFVSLPNDIPLQEESFADPLLYKSVFDSQEERVSAVETETHALLAEMLQQLQVLQPEITMEDLTRDM